jgi:23S rRNA (guanosine2251-2'-O)-methyltransferase
MNNRAFLLILHNIRSVYNVGSLFRTAEAAGISKICLSGYTPQPIDRFGNTRSDFHKSALGSEHTIEWYSVRSLTLHIRKLKKEGWHIVAVEQSPQSVYYARVKTKKKTVFILGNEVRGLSSALVKLADVVAEIPMKGKKESLNVSVAGGVALFRILGL